MDGNVNVYVYDMTGSEFDPSKLCLIEQKRREGILTSADPNFKRRSLYAGLLLRRVVMEEGISADGPLQVEYGEHGKPFIGGAHFNMTHTGNIVMVAAAEFEIGIDAERADRRVPQNVCRMALSPNEYAEYIKKGDDKDSFFISKWIAKESYLKCIGSGISGYPSDIEAEGDSVRGLPVKYGRVESMGQSYVFAVCGRQPFSMTVKYVITP